MSAKLRLVALAVLLGAAPAWALQVDTLLQNGASANRIDLVILGDGYRSTDQAQLSADAQSMMAALFAVSPLDAYQKLFNVKLIHVVSNQNGADNGTYGAVRDTALDSNFNCAGVQRLLCVSTSKVLSTAAANVPEFDIALVIVNDPMYGGSGGTVPVSSINSSSVGVLRHEFGHSLSRLGDEYETAGSLSPCPSTDCVEPNVTIRNTRSQIKWNAWIPASYPVPTPETSTYSDIGVFEGARYQATGVYRPKYSGCLMRSLTSPFCSVCREGVVRSLWDRVSPVDTRSPSNGSVSCTAGANQTFSVSVPPVNTTWRYTWTVGGALQSASGPSLTVPCSSATVAVTVSDTTPFVRNDPQGLLSQTVTWTMQGGTTTTPTCTPGVCQSSGTWSNGACVYTPSAAGTSCGAPAQCVNGVAYAAAQCNGSGSCVAGSSTSCGRYSCNASGTACMTQCGSDSHCANGYVCFAEQCVPPSTEGPDAGTPGGTSPDAGTPETTEPDASTSDAGTPVEPGEVPEAPGTEPTSPVTQPPSGPESEPADPLTGEDATPQPPPSGCAAALGMEPAWAVAALLGFALRRRRQ